MINSLLRRRAPLLAAALVASAAIPLSTRAAGLEQPEVRHIIDFVRASSCTFIRNGSNYTSADAADHIAIKAGYAGSRITNGDTLIDLVATKSSMSGRAYHVQCPGQSEMESGTWLHTELDRYRSGQASAIPTTP